MWLLFPMFLQQLEILTSRLARELTGGTASRRRERLHATVSTKDHGTDGGDSSNGWDIFWVPLAQVGEPDSGCSLVWSGAQDWRTRLCNYKQFLCVQDVLCELPSRPTGTGAIANVGKFRKLRSSQDWRPFLKSSWWWRSPGWGSRIAVGTVIKVPSFFWC